MGSLTLPTSGPVYIDSNCIIYAVERVQPFFQTLEPLLEAAIAGRASLFCSELGLLEVLVKPIREKKRQLEVAFRSFLGRSQEVRLQPINRSVLDRATRIRAKFGFNTPDAIHAATAMEVGATMFVTNDAGFSRLDELSVAVLSALQR